jgi:RNA polymerase sigma-B factor
MRLQALASCQEPAQRLRLRNAIVRDNLPLVYAIVARMGPTAGLSCEDLRQIGSLGLLKAVEAFEPSRGGQLSSFAVPYIRGAIQHELRDRHSLIRVPRDLWDLRRRATALLERRRQRAEVPLGPQQLADTLGCDRGRLVEALQLGAVTEMRSLDAPLGGEAAGDGPERLLLDTVADPASLAAAPDAPGHCASGPRPWPWEGMPLEDSGHATDSGVGCRQRWLAESLGRLEPHLRRLLIGHFDGCSWVELGRELQIHPRQAQRLTVATMARLEAEGRSWLAGRGDGDPLLSAATG